MIRINLMPGVEESASTGVSTHTSSWSGADQGASLGAGSDVSMKKGCSRRNLLLLILLLFLCGEAVALVHVQRSWQEELTELQVANSIRLARIRTMESRVADVPSISRIVDQLKASNRQLQDYNALKGNGVRLLEEVAFVLHGGGGGSDQSALGLATTIGKNGEVLSRAGLLDEPGLLDVKNEKHGQRFILLTWLEIQNGEIMMEGVANDMNQVVSLVDRMKKSPLWVGVSLNLLKGAVVHMPDRREVVRFSLSCNSPLALCSSAAAYDDGMDELMLGGEVVDLVELENSLQDDGVMP